MNNKSTDMYTAVNIYLTKMQLIQINNKFKKKQHLNANTQDTNI